MSITQLPHIVTKFNHISSTERHLVTVLGHEPTTEEIAKLISRQERLDYQVFCESG